MLFKHNYVLFILSKLTTNMHPDLSTHTNLACFSFKEQVAPRQFNESFDASDGMLEKIPSCSDTVLKRDSCVSDGPFLGCVHSLCLTRR